MKSLPVRGVKTILFILFAVASLFSTSRALSQEYDTALNYARARDLEIERVVHEEGFVYQFDNEKAGGLYYNELGYHCFLGNLDRVKSLVEEGADVDCVVTFDNWYVGSALFAAVSGESIEVVNYLISIGVKLDLPYGEASYTPLIEVIKNYNDREMAFTITKLLLDAGANPNGYGNVSYENSVPTYYPLIEAVMKGDAEIVELLIDSGADFELENSWEPSIIKLIDDLPDKELIRRIKGVVIAAMLGL